MKFICALVWKSLKRCSERSSWPRISGGGKKHDDSALVEFTGLSRSVFSKEHIGVLLVAYGYSGIKTQERKKSTKKEKLAEIPSYAG